MAGSGTGPKRKKDVDYFLYISLTRHLDEITCLSISFLKPFVNTLSIFPFLLSAMSYIEDFKSLGMGA